MSCFVLRAACCVLLILAAACGGRFEVPVPVLAAPLAPPPPSEPANITLPIAIAVSKIRAQLDTAFPVTDSLDRARCTALGGLVCHRYLYRRDSLDLRVSGDRVQLRTRLRYGASVGIPGVGGIASCGFGADSMKRADVRLATTLFWRSDWRLGSRGTTVSADLLDRCEVTMLRFDASATMKRIVEAQTALIRQQIDSAVPAVANLAPVADSLWRMLQEPVALDSSESVWLTMRPEGVSLTPLSGAGSTVNTALVLTARPRVVMGGKPAPESRPLPTLTLGRRGSGIHVPVEIELPFSELSQKVTSLVSGEVAGKGIRIGEIKLWGVGDTAVVTVGVEGQVNGSLYLLGRVSYDSVSRAVLLGDLRYTLASHDAMSRIKATLGANRIKSAIDEATGRGRLAVGEQLDSLRSQLTQELNRPLAPGVTLAGSVRDVRFIRMYTTASAFVLRVALDGEAVLIVR